MKKKILLVDGDEQIRRSLAKVLRMDGYETVAAEDCRHGLEIIKKEDVHLLILDIRGPLKHWWTSIRRITRHDPHTPIIIITGREDQFDLAFAAGAAAFMEKPLDVPLLMMIVGQLLNANHPTPPPGRSGPPRALYRDHPDHSKS